MNEKLKKSTLALKVTRATEDRQFWVEGHSAKAGDFDHTYVSFSGYFGSYGPNMFAAAPELLEALTACRAELFLKVSNEHGPKFARQYPEIVAAEAAIAKATGKTSEAA